MKEQISVINCNFDFFCTGVLNEEFPLNGKFSYAIAPMSIFFFFKSILLN